MIWISRKFHRIHLFNINDLISFSFVELNFISNYSEDGLKEAADKDKYMIEFFQNVKAWSRENDLKKDLKFDENDKVNEKLSI